MRVCELIKYVIWETKTKQKNTNDMHVSMLLHCTIKVQDLKKKHKKVSFDPRIIIF